MIKLVYRKEVFDKIMYFVEKSPVECSGLGMVRKEKGVWTVTDAFMLPQKNTATTTDIDPEDMAKALFDYKDHPDEMILWWHSHVNMGVFWSPTDKTTITDFAKGGQCVATVFNKKGEYLSALMLYDCFKDPMLGDGIWWEKIETKIEAVANADLLKKWDEEYAKNIKPLVVSTSNYTGTNHYSWYSQYNSKQGSLGFQESKDKTGNSSTTSTTSTPAGGGGRSKKGKGKDKEKPILRNVNGEYHTTASSKEVLEMVQESIHDDLDPRELLPGEPWYDFSSKAWYDDYGNELTDDQACAWFEENWSHIEDRQRELNGGNA